MHQQAKLHREVAILIFLLFHKEKPTTNKEDTIILEFSIIRVFSRMFVSHYMVLKPPSAIIIPPVTYADKSEARKIAGPAISTGAPGRPRGV